MRETRAPVLLRRKAKKLREERGMKDGGRYTARSEVDKPALGAALKLSLSRPISQSSFLLSQFHREWKLMQNSVLVARTCCHLFCTLGGPCCKSTAPGEEVWLMKAAVGSILH